ncbi:MAG TPA: hypothetical protein VMV52_02035 [Candidatus Nanopelagicaceae bacterium]|nr:hypothetical protein [Candidatus Nanopelagicaceae bacterium]
MTPYLLHQKEIARSFTENISTQFKGINALAAHASWSKDLGFATLFSRSTESLHFVDALQMSTGLKEMANQLVNQRIFINSGPSQSEVLSAHILEATRSTRLLSDWACTRLNPDTATLRGIASLTRDLHEFVDTFAPMSTSLQLRGTTLGGFATNGLIGAQILGPRFSQSSVDETIDRVEIQVIDPWSRARLNHAVELLETIETLAPDAADTWRGAWEEAQDPRSGAVTKIADCGIETFDRCLRAAAPDERVRVWLGDNPGEEMYVRGRPTRAARISFVLQDRPAEKRFAVSVEKRLTKQVNDHVSDLQSAKHGAETGLARARALLSTTESLLAQIFLSE